MRISDWSSDVCSSDLVNCAGTTRRGPEAFDEEAFQHVVDVNLSGTMRACRAFRGKLGRSGGTIRNIATMMSVFRTGTAPRAARRRFWQECVATSRSQLSQCPLQKKHKNDKRKK